VALFHNISINILKIGAATPEANISKTISCIIAGQKYKPNAVQLARQEAQLKGLKFSFHLA
jgi:hypothetical protein